VGQTRKHFENRHKAICLALSAIMKQRIILLLFLFTFTQALNAQKLDDKYYFVNGLEVFGIKQSRDTIYEFKCYANLQCQERMRKHYKIIQSKDTLNWTLVKIERLDSIPFSTEPVRKDRFMLWGFEKVDVGKIRIVKQRMRFTLDSIQSLPINSLLTEERFGFTYYNEEFLTDLKTDYKVDSLTAAEIVFGFKDYESLLILYKNSNVSDMYGSGITAELVALELIKRGWSPLYGVHRLNEAMKADNKR
jgi:hypothetical protein